MEANIRMMEVQTMDYKFLLIDSQSELKMGDCRQISGLDGKIYRDGDSLFHKISLEEFYFTEEFKQHIKKHKESLTRLIFIRIMSKDNKHIVDLPFTIYEEIYYHKIGFPTEPIKIDLKGSLQKRVFDGEIELWKKWRTNIPKNKNEWVCLTEKKRRRWLEIVRKFHFEKEVINTYKTDETYYLDGLNITDYSSFFCALGEAINGPGGYFGFDMMSLRDCLSGGFGAQVPFTIVWNASSKSIDMLNKEAWIREIKNTKEDTEYLLESPEFEEKGDCELFIVLIKIFLEYGVTVILNP